MINKRFKVESTYLLIWLLFFYGFHFGLRAWSSSNFGDSDAAQALLLNQVAWGYSDGSGPIYTWMLHYAVQVFGYSVISFLVLKYFLIGCLYFLIYKSYLVFSSDRKWALLAAISFGSLYFLMWRIHEVMTDRLFTAVMALACFYYFFSRPKSSSSAVSSVLVLGGLFGMGFLTEIHFYVIPLSFLLYAVVGRSSWRLPEVFLAAALGAVVALPFFKWLIDHEQLNFFVFGAQQRPDIVVSWAFLRTGLLHPLYVLSPALLMLLPFLLGRRGADPMGGQASADVSMLKGYFICLYPIWVLVFGVLIPYKNNEAHTALIGFLPFLILVMNRLEGLNRNRKIVFAVLCVFPLVAIGFRVGNLLVEEPFCRNCRWSIPYESLAKAIDQSVDFDERVVICSSNADVLANLKISFPNNNYQLIGAASMAECSAVSNYLHIEEQHEPIHFSNESAVCKQERDGSIYFKIKWPDPHWASASKRGVRYSFWKMQSNLSAKEICTK